MDQLATIAHDAPARLDGEKKSTSNHSFAWFIWDSASSDSFKVGLTGGRRLTDLTISFEEAMRRELGAAPSNIIADGKIHRFSAGKNKGDKSAWYIFHDGDFTAGKFDDWKTGEQHTWHRNGACRLSQEDRSRIKVQQAQREAEIDKAQKRAAKEASALWEKASPASSNHPYLAKKKVSAPSIREDGGKLIIPVRIGGEITSLQTIDATGRKMFLKDGRVSGGFFQFGEIGPVIIIAEGFATAAALYEFFGTAVIAAFSASNLLLVAKAIREKYPDAKIVLAADDDFETALKRGKNPGIEYAVEAASSIGASVAIPPFNRSEGDTGTDWNDFFAAYGADACRAAFNAKAADAKSEAVEAKVIEFPSKTKRQKSDKPNSNSGGGADSQSHQLQPEPVVLFHPLPRRRTHLHL